MEHIIQVPVEDIISFHNQILKVENGPPDKPTTSFKG